MDRGTDKNSARFFTLTRYKDFFLPYSAVNVIARRIKSLYKGNMELQSRHTPKRNRYQMGLDRSVQFEYGRFLCLRSIPVCMDKLLADLIFLFTQCHSIQQKRLLLFRPRPIFDAVKTDARWCLPRIQHEQKRGLTIRLESAHAFAQFCAVQRQQF